MISTKVIEGIKALIGQLYTAFGKAKRLSLSRTKFYGTCAISLDVQFKCSKRNNGVHNVMKDSMSDVELKDKIHTTPNAKYVAIHLSINQMVHYG